MADKRLALFLGSDVQPPDTDAVHANLLLTDLGGGDYGLAVAGATVGGGSPIAPVVKGPVTDRSGVIAVDATSQVLCASNADRRYLLVQNVGTINLWVNFNVAAVQNQPSILLLPNGIGRIEYEGSFIVTQSVNIIGATAAGSAFTAKEG